MKCCPKCKQNKEIVEFSKNNSNYDGLQDYCRQCKAKWDGIYYKNHKKIHYERVKKYIDKNRLRLWKHLSTRACVDCGANDPIVLEFDHVKGKKLLAISRMVTNYSWESMKKEMDKCEIRCANCHRIKTAKEKGWYKFLTP